MNAPTPDHQERHYNCERENDTLVILSLLDLVRTGLFYGGTARAAS